MAFGRDGEWRTYTADPGSRFERAWWLRRSDGEFAGAYIIQAKGEINIHPNATTSPLIAGPFDTLDAAKAAYLTMFSGG